MFALVLFALVVSGVLGIVFISPAVGRKWDQLSGARWERKLLAGVTQIEVEEELAKSKPTEEEIAAAERELDEEMQDWS
jgi:hypothetical protein